METQILPRETDELPRYGGHGSRPEETGKGLVVERFSHLVVGVTKLDVSEAWYRDVVGLDLLGRDLTAEPNPHSVLQTNTGQMVILVESKSFDRPPRNSRHQAFLMTPNAYRRAYERLQGMGMIISDTHEGHRALGNYSIDLMDPDGHRFQIQTYGPECHEYQPSDAGVVDCGPAERYKSGDVKPFKQGNFYLVRLREGFLALNRWCTHMNGIVVYQKAHWHFYCPYHYATYDRRGEPSPYPGNRAGGPLRLHPVTFSNEGHVLVDTSQVIERSAYEPGQAAVPPSGDPAQAVA